MTSLVLNGLVLGSILLLSSLGLTLIYGVGRVINFAHGAFFSLGAMCAVWVIGWGFPFWSALIVAPIVVGMIGIIVDYALLARIRNRPMVDSLLLTFGLALFITGALYQFGGANVQIPRPPSALAGTVTAFGITLPTYRIFISGLAVTLLAALLFFLKNSSWGVRVRAANDDSEMAACLGINRETLMHSVVGLSAALVAIAGAAAAPIFAASATVGDKMLILAFMTVILGGLGSLRGTVAAAYIVGLISVLGEGYFGGQVALMILFIMVMAMLIRWPLGIFGDGRLE